MTHDVRRLAGRGLDVFIPLLVALRPLIWDGESSALPALLWWGLFVVALLVTALAGTPLRRPGAAGWLALLALALLAPGALHSPSGFDGLAAWGQWAGLLIFAGWLSAVGAGRERLIIAGLASGFAIELAYSFGQWSWAIPQLAAEAATGEVVGTGMEPWAIAERARNGGVFGSFTLSNALAAYLLLTVPVAVGIAARARGAARLGPALLAVLGSVLLWLTNSKGGLVAGAIAAAVIVVWYGRHWWRWAVPAVGLVAAIVLIALPSTRALFHASFAVRLGYWHGAAGLITEAPFSGHGLGGYAAHAARHLALGAEYSRWVHNEWIEAAVSGGVLAGLAVLAWGACLALRPAQPVIDAAPAPSWAPLVFVMAIPYLHVFGLVPLGGWPGVTGDLGLLYALLLGGLGAVVGWGALRLPLPPAWAIQAGLLALMIHATQDFDFQAGGVVDTAAVLAALAGGARPLSGAQRPWLSVVLAVGVGVALAFGSWRGRAIANAISDVQSIGNLPQIARTEGQQAFIAQLKFWHTEFGLPPPTPADVSHAGVTRLLRLACARAFPVLIAWPPAETQWCSDVLRELPPGKARLPYTTALVARAPFQARAQRLLADDFAALEQWPEAVAAARVAVRNAPNHLPHRERLAQLLDKTAAIRGDPVLLAEAEFERAEIERLTPLVHWRDRPNGGR